MKTGSAKRLMMISKINPWAARPRSAGREVACAASRRNRKPLTPRSVLTMEGSRPASSAPSVAMLTKPLDPQTNTCGLSVKPGQNFLDHHAVDPSRKVRCADRVLARNCQRQGECRIAAFDGMKLFEKRTSSAVRADRSSAVGTTWLVRGAAGSSPSTARGRSLPRSTALGLWQVQAAEMAASGPRSSISSPIAATSWKNGETSPSGRRSIASSTVGNEIAEDAIE